MQIDFFFFRNGSTVKEIHLQNEKITTDYYPPGTGPATLFVFTAMVC